jgi:asparagine synthase (glutamine-hydrolysing)
MCGIAGIISLGGAAPAAEALRGACGALVHRGPDDEAIDIRGQVGLGMRRLAVIDVAGGRQPYFNEDGTVRAVFNGEIYNFRELRRSLAARGHRFTSRTDGEVIVHLWEEHGPEFLRMLNGMFAIALHDARQQRVVLARDRLGVKPLYYARTRDHLVFGSEVKAILASGVVDRGLDVDALGEFLAWEYVPAPRTLFTGIMKLEPAQLLSIDLASPRLCFRTWWDIPLPDEQGLAARGTGEWVEAVDEKIRAAVQRQLISDVPLGAFLSGGVDSSLVVAGMGDARVFTIGFDDPTYNELRWARAVAAHLGVRHEVEVIRPDAIELFDRIMPFLDDPIADSSVFPTYLVSRLARGEVTVALTGDGGDELFGGYETYVAQQLAGAWARVPRLLREGLLAPLIRRARPRPAKKGLVNKAKRFVEGLEHDEALGHARWRLFMGERLRRELFTPEAESALRAPAGSHILRLTKAAGPRSPLASGLYTDVKSYLSDNCLLKVDRMSMACSLEVRVPLLDHELVELAFSVPDRLKVRRGETKVLLKQVAARAVPRACVYRQKEGFSTPIKHWLRGPFRPMLEEALAPERVRREGLFRVEAVEALKREHLAGRANHSHVLWALLVFQDWRQRWRV